MKKVLYGLFLFVILLSSVAFADVVTFNMGEYHIGDLEIPALIVAGFVFIIVLAISIAGTIHIKKHVETKWKRIVCTIVIWVVAIVLLLFIRLPEPSYNHGWGPLLDSYRVNSHNEIFSNYFGHNKSYANINSLINTINAFNSRTSERALYGAKYVISESIPLEVTNNNNKTGNNDKFELYKTNDVKTGYYYTIEAVDYYEDLGTIKTIRIEGSETRTEN